MQTTMKPCVFFNHIVLNNIIIIIFIIIIYLFDFIVFSRFLNINNQKEKPGKQDTLLLKFRILWSTVSK